MEKHTIAKFRLSKPWRSLGEFESKFHEKINIFVGVNSSGKSSLLDLISANTRLFRSIVSPLSLEDKPFGHFTNYCPTHDDNDTVVVWEDDKRGFVGGVIRDSKVQKYHANIKSLYFTSNRGTDTSGVNSFNKLEPYSLQEVYEIIQSNQKLRITKWTSFIERVLVGWIVAAAPQSKYLESDVESQTSYENLLNDFSSLLANFFPAYLKFERLVNKNNEIHFILGGDSIKLKNLSSGLAILLEYIFGIFVFDRVNGEKGHHTGYCVLIDEIENHIHPKLERELVPKLSEAFPSAQFFIATHSPVVASSTNESKIFILRQDEKQDNLLFTPEEQDMNTSIDSFSSTLYEVIGLPTLIPYWLEKSFDKVYNTSYSEKESVHLDNFLTICDQKGIGVWATMYWNMKRNGSTKN